MSVSLGLSRVAGGRWLFGVHDTFARYLAQFAKLEALLELEREVQRMWECERIFELDAPKVASCCSGISGLRNTLIHISLRRMERLGRSSGEYNPLSCLPLAMIKFFSIAVLKTNTL